MTTDITALTPPTTRLIVRIDDDHQVRHDQNLRYLRQLHSPPDLKRRLVTTLLDLSAQFKATALRGYLRTFTQEQTNVVFCRSQHEYDHILVSTEDAGFAATTDPSNWQTAGGVLLIRSYDPPPGVPDLSQAMFAIFVGRPPSKRKFLALQSLAAPAGACHHPQLVHFIAHDTIDEPIADYLLRPPHFNA